MLRFILFWYTKEIGTACVKDLTSNFLYPQTTQTIMYDENTPKKNM